MQNICSTCGTRYSDELPKTCLICSDDRQYVHVRGQQWTSLVQLAEIHAIKFSPVTQNLQTLKMVPSFAIDQRAFLVQSEGGNILWDCLPFVDNATISYIQSLGGISAIAISHPHYYSMMTVWADFFNCPIYLHEMDKEWIMDMDERYVLFWDGAKKELWDGVEIIHTGGHFAGSNILYLPHFNNGILLTGDSMLVGRDRKSVTSMYSYPNLIPLAKRDIEKIIRVVHSLSFDSIYAAFDGMDISKDAKNIFSFCMNRYLSIVSQ